VTLVSTTHNSEVVDNSHRMLASTTPSWEVAPVVAQLVEPQVDLVALKPDIATEAPVRECVRRVSTRRPMTWDLQ
jgi:hypothetical protein